MSDCTKPVCPKCGNALVSDRETQEWVCIYCGFISDSQGPPRSNPPSPRETQKRLELLNRVAEQFGKDKVDAILKDDPILKQAWDLQLVRDVSKSSVLRRQMFTHHAALRARERSDRRPVLKLSRTVTL